MTTKDTKTFNQDMKQASVTLVKDQTNQQTLNCGPETRRNQLSLTSWCSNIFTNLFYNSETRCIVNHQDKQTKHLLMPTTMNHQNKRIKSRKQELFYFA